jgi:chemotaxis protein methyltransferase CheR
MRIHLFFVKQPDMDLSATRRHTPGADLTDIPPETFNRIMNVLKRLRNFNIDIYKEKCIKRRIAIRIRKSGFSSAAEYGEFLMRDEKESDNLIRVLTVHVSQFFRNPSMFMKLKEEILPYLFRSENSNPAERPVIWSVGCAGGEEPYSIAMLIEEYLAGHPSSRGADILATDIDAEILESAEKAIYHAERLREVPVQEINRWFTPENGKFKLASEIRDMVTFRRSDIYETAAYPECSLILCRNVLIYLDRKYQEKILNGFADALRSGGILILGKAETLVGESRRRYHTMCPVERIYRVV